MSDARICFSEEVFQMRDAKSSKHEANQFGFMRKLEVINRTLIHFPREAIIFASDWKSHKSRMNAIKKVQSVFKLSSVTLAVVIIGVLFSKPNQLYDFNHTYSHYHKIQHCIFFVHWKPT